MKLCLTMMDDRWVGVVDLDGELFKVIFIPGSATTEWRATLQPTLFVELNSPQMIKAIEKAKEDFDRPPSSIQSPKATNLFSSSLMEKIASILKDEEDGSTNLQEG